MKDKTFRARALPSFFLNSSLSNLSLALGAFTKLTFFVVEWKINAVWYFCKGLSNMEACRAVEVCLNIESG